MSVNNTNAYSFKSASSRLSNYKIYGSDKYTANYKIYGNTIDGSSVGDLKNLSNPNDLQQGYYAYADGSSVLGNLGWVCTKKIPCKSNTNYTFSFKNPSRWAGFVWYDSSDTYISTSNRNSGFTNGGYYTAQSPSSAAYFVVNIAGYPDDNASITVDNIIDLMIKKGSTPSEYEPYGYKVPIRVTGKNLLKVGTSQTSNGVTFTVNSDGSVTCNGTASATTFYGTYIHLQKGSYIISGCPQNGSDTSYMISMRDVITGSPYPNINGNDLGNSKLMTITEYLYFKHVIRIASGYTCDNLTFYPMIRRADIEDSTYEPYREEIHNVYLDSPLTKSGDNTDYIDFKEQKRVNIDGTEEYIKLPEFNIESENDSIFIDTDTQPSNIDFDILHGVGDRTENLFDATKANRVLNSAYNADGNIVTTENSNYFNYYIPVLSNTTYTIKTNSNTPPRIFYFDKNKTWLGRSDLADTEILTGTSRTFITPNNCYYIMFQESKTSTMNENSIMLVEGSNVPSEYEPYGYKVPIRVISKNLFIKPVEQGSIYTATGRYDPNNTTRIYSKNIPLIPGKTYTISCNNNLKLRFIGSYFNDTYIGQLYLNYKSSNAESQTTITIPENANNISVSFWDGNNSETVIPSDLEWCQIEEGETATEYEEPFNQITNIYLDEPLLKVGDNADYIDYSAQKKYTYNNTVESMMLPNIPVNVGENKLMIDTLIKPSNISISVLNDNDGAIPVDTNNKQEKIKHIFKTTEDTLRNYQIYGSNKYAANYRIYGNTEIPENLFDENSTWNIHSCINTENIFPYTADDGTMNRTYFMEVEGSTTYKINMTSCGDRLKVVYYNTNIDPTTYTTSSGVTATGVIYSSNGRTSGVITSGKNLCMTFTTPSNAKVIGIFYSRGVLPTGFTITKVKNNYSVGNLVNLFDENSEVITLNSIDDAGVLTHNANVDTYDYIPVEPNTIYRAKSFGIGSGSLSIRAAYYDSSKTFISRVISNKNDTFTTPINCVYIRLSIDKSKPIHDLQISLTKGDSDPATYEPYGYKVPIRVTGKNLLKVGTNQTINGVTFAVNSDGSVTCNGTASVNTFFHLKQFYLQKGSYIISGCPQNGSMSSYIITMRDGKTGNYYSGINGDDTGTGKTMITTEYLRFVCIIRIASGYTCDNLTFYPMIRRADIEDSTYEPYREEIHNVYLDSPLTKSGDNTDYIDFKEQKRVNIDGTEEYIKLPELKIESENDSIFIDTDTQPSNIDFDILHGVGDRTENLFDGVFEQGTMHGDRVGSSCDDIKSTITSTTNHLKRVRTKNLIYVNNSCTVSADFTKYDILIYKFDENQLYTKNVGKMSSSCTITDAYYIVVVVCKKDDSNFTPEEANDVNLMINSGSTALQYKIPIKVQGKNLFNSSVEQGGLDSSNGIKYTSGLYYTNRLCSGYINLTSNKTYTISSNMKIKMIIAYNENKYISRLLNTDEDLLYSTITLPSNANNIRVVFWSGTNDIAVEPSNFEWGQIEEGEVVTEYEEPFSSTNNIYLNRPLLKDGSDYDYIDYSEQKRYNYDGTIENITIHHVLTNNGMNTLTFDSLVQPLQSFIKYYDEDAETPIVDSSSSFEASFTTSGTQLLNYRIWGTDTGLGNINLFDFDAWWETIKNNVRNGSVKRGKNQSFTITPTGEDAYTSMASAVYSGGYRIYVEPNSSYTWSWNKECTNNAYYGRQMIFLDGRSETGYMFSCTGSTSLTFTTKSDTSFIMLRFGCGTNTDTPITFSNITLSKNNSNPNILINTSDMNDISTWDSNLYARPTKTVENNSWVIGQIIDVTNINSLYIVGDTKIVYDNIIRVGKSNEQITNGSTLLSYTAFTVLPQIIDTSDCNYIIISVSIYNNYKNTTFEQIKNTFKIYKAPPNTTIITLPRKLFKTDTNIEYIDYESQKLYSTNNVNADISLPSISTVVGKNKLRIPPDKKPSKLMIKYLT